MLDDVAWLRGPRAGGRSSSSATPAGRRALPRKPPGSARPGHPLLFPAAGRRSRWHPVPTGRGGAGMLGPACARAVPVEGTSP
jgi:hypothetical protein